MDIPGNTPTHLILIDFSYPPHPDALFPGTALMDFNWWLLTNNNYLSVV